MAASYSMGGEANLVQHIASDTHSIEDGHLEGGGGVLSLVAMVHSEALTLTTTG